MAIIFYSILWISMAAENQEFDGSPFNQTAFSNSPFNSQPYLNLTTAESLEDSEKNNIIFSQKKMQVFDDEDVVIKENYIEEEKSQFDLALQKIDNQLYKIQSVSTRGSTIINEISPFTLRNKSNTCPHFTFPEITCP